MANFETYEHLFEVWVRWRSGALKNCSPLAREILLTVLGEMAESSQRGHLVHLDGKPIPIGEVRGLLDPYQTIGQWAEGPGECANWPKAVAELRGAGFLAQAANGVWFSPQMVAGEI